MNNKAKILDIAMNLNRVGNWAADDYSGKKERIKTFLDNTNLYIAELKESEFPSSFAKTYKDFKKQYLSLEKQGVDGPQDPLAWAESMMTWGNILTHRSRLIG